MGSGKTFPATGPEASRTRGLHENCPLTRQLHLLLEEHRAGERAPRCHLLLTTGQSVSALRALKRQSEQINEEGVAWMLSRMDPG